MDDHIDEEDTIDLHNIYSFTLCVGHCGNNDQATVFALKTHRLRGRQLSEESQHCVKYRVPELKVVLWSTEGGARVK